MSAVKTPRVFIRNDEEPGPWLYCGVMPPNGESRAGLMKAIGQMVLNEIDCDMGGTDSDVFRMEVKVKEMTDAEVEAMPED